MSKPMHLGVFGGENSCVTVSLFVCRLGTDKTQPDVSPEAGGLVFPTPDKSEGCLGTDNSNSCRSRQDLHSESRCLWKLN